MRHDLIVTGHAFGLRPIMDDDAALVLELRSDPQLNRHIHATSPSLSDQRAWLARYYEREGDYYFVVERLSTGTAEGVISLYDMDAQRTQAEWGRWILRRGSRAAVESAWLIYRCAFEVLGLAEVYCRTVADNASVVSFHDSCGITQRRVLKDFFELGGHRVDAVEHRLQRSGWAEIGPRLEQLSLATARRLQRG